MEVVAVCLEDTLEEDKFERLLSYVSTEKRGRINRFLRHEDAERALIGDILTRSLICRRLEIKNRELIFGINEYGKPFLMNDEDIQFNISHSGKWVTCSLDYLPVGIDVEQVKPIDMNIAARFFSKLEWKDLLSKSILERETYFYDLWTLKESYIKAVGKGLSIPLDSFSIRIHEEDIWFHSLCEPNNYYFKQYYIDRNYKMAVCSMNNEFPRDLGIIDSDKLCEEALLL